MNAFYTHIPFPDRLVHIAVGGRHTGAWNLYGPERQKTLERLVVLSDVYEIKKLLVPTVTSSNGKIVSSSRMISKVQGDVSVFDSVEADGAFLNRGEALALATGDCPTIVMQAKRTNYAIAAHAGRHSLLGSFSDALSEFSRGKKPSENVVSKMLEHFKTRRVRFEDIQVFVVLGISGQAFSHPKSHPELGRANRRMLDFVRKNYGPQCILDSEMGNISLFKIIEAQCKSRGIPTNSIRSDGCDTFSDKDAKNEYAWWSNRRGEKGRNLVLVRVIF